MIPSGKGIYGRSKFLDATYAKFLRDHGIMWFVPISLSKLQSQTEIGKKYDIQVHAGMIPLPNGSKRSALTALTKIQNTADAAYASSIHLDMEEGVFWDADFCTEFMVKALADPGYVGITCYPSHKGKLAGMGRADYYLAQMYDRGKVETKDQYAMYMDGLEKFKKISCGAPIGIGIGAFLNYKSGGVKVTTVKPLDRFKRHLTATPSCEFAAVWTLPSFQTDTKKYAAWWDAIGEWHLS